MQKTRKHHFFTSGDFASKADLLRAKQWADSLCAQIEQRGEKVEFFSPWESKLEPGDTVHIFGITQIENWIRIKQKSCKVVVYSLENSIEKNRFCTPARWKIWLNRAKRKLNPLVEGYEAVLQSVDLYFVTAEERDVLAKYVQPKKIKLISNDFLKISQDLEV